MARTGLTGDKDPNVFEINVTTIPVDGKTPYSADRQRPRDRLLDEDLEARGICVVAPAERRRPFEPHPTAADEDKRAAIAVILPGTCRTVQSPLPHPAAARSRGALCFVSAIAGAAGHALPRFARAAEAVVLPSAADDRRFSVFYSGDRIGAHTVSFSAANGQTRITTEIDLLVKALFFAVYSFRHRSEEIWRDGRLASLKSETVEKGATIQVTGAATAHGFRIVSKGRPFVAAADVVFTSNALWTPAALQQATVIDAQYGGVIGISVRKLADEQIAIAGRQIRATRYRFITPFVAGSLWYDDRGLWVHGEFERDAAQIVYRLDL